MRFKQTSFYRTDSLDKSCPDWLEAFAEQEAIKDARPKTAVEVARERNKSIYQQVSAIVSGSVPRFGSVEEVVKDYQKRTGLAEYLDKKASVDMSAIAAEVIEAGKKKV